MTNKLEECPFSDYGPLCETGPVDKAYCDLCLKGSIADRLSMLIAVVEHR
jgi:hypothetical protein